MKERYLYDENGEPVASVSLEDVKKLAQSLFNESEYKIETVQKDYNEYRLFQYVTIRGACASLKIAFFYYGETFNKKVGLECSVQLRGCAQDTKNPVFFDYSKAKNGLSEIYNEYYFSFKDNLNEVVRNELTIGANYVNQLTKWLNENSKYLNADADLFVRIDLIKSALPKDSADYDLSSYFNYSSQPYLIDDDFYADAEINHNAKRTKLTVEPTISEEQFLKLF